MVGKRASGLWAHAANLRHFRAGTGTDAETLKEQLEEIRAQAPTPVEAAPASAWLEAAAVLARFDPSALRDAQGRVPPDFDTFEALIDASEPAMNAGGARTLRLADRRRMLGDLGDAESLRRVLAPNAPGPDVPVQHGLALLLEGPEAVARVRADRDAERLAGLAEALLWVEGILPDLPDRDAILQELAAARLVEPLRELVGGPFAGREALLGRMYAYFREPLDVDNILYLHGVGGTGKSTTLAKFAMDLRERGTIDLIAYLNFDRATLDVREPLTVLREMVVQIAAQAQHKEVEGLRAEIDDYIRRFAGDRSVLESSFDGGGNWEGMIGGVAEAIRAIPGDGPFLVLVDTFEQAQRYGETVVREFWRMFNHLGKQAPRLRIIAAGRVDQFELFQNAVALGGLDAEAVGAVLEETCGAAVDDALVDAVVEATEGRPLGVRLAGLLFKRIGLSNLDDPQHRTEALLEVRSEQAEAVLYNRILGQIGDLRVRRLARWGLLLRHVTPGLIAEVLAPVAGLLPSGISADELFDLYGREVDLCEPGYADWGEPMLTHRGDVRAIMLGDLREGEPEVVGAIDRGAIDYFARQKGAMARAEEIYHRLWADEAMVAVEARWTPDCAVHLQDTVDEIPLARRPWLANRLGFDLPQDAMDEADQAEWETFALRSARTALNRGDPEGALDVLRQRNARLPGSALYALEADALSQQQQVAEAREVITRGLDSAAGAGTRRQAAELWLVRALIEERSRHFARASRDATSAYGIGEDLEDLEITLRAIATLLRLRRKSRNVAGPEAEDLVERANVLLDRAGTSVLLDRPGLMRALAGELGPVRPALLATAVQQTGQDTITEAAPEVRAVERQAVEQLSGPRYARVADVLETIGQAKDDGLRSNMSYLTSVAGERGLLPQVAAPVARVLAAEVDQLIGAFPAQSMQRQRDNHSWWQQAGVVVES
ncbi:AAA family ATPase [Antarctobacter jejuensis]|uniref:AAA family ATPase n=1 Tax=Antarctobacter jejuensis TaxID=1439938 RepID=UPI003FD64C9F